MENASVFIKNDLINIIENFISQYNVRFTTFFKIWNDTKFYLIFNGKQHAKEKFKFTETILSLASEFLLDVNNFQIQIGSIYLLYCLYYSQNHQPKLKIRFTIEHLNVLEAVINKLTSQQHYDTLYILLQLFSDNAIHIVFSAHEADHFRKKHDTPDLKSQIVEDIHLKHALKKLIPKDSIMDDLHKNYISHTQKLNEICPDLSSLINNFDHDFLSKYHETVNNGINELETAGSLISEKHIKDNRRMRKAKRRIEDRNYK